jgi:hypothetical protein
MATWVGPPRSYTKGRARPVQYVVIHSTEGSEGVKSAEAGAAYDKIRTDGTSTHLFVDTDTALMEVRYTDTAHAARTHGNACGIQVELCGRAGQSDVQWHDAASLPMLRLAATEVAAICREFNLPVRRLSVAEVRAAYYAPEGQRPKGICGHIDVTLAYPEDQGSHTDPGPNFPWAEFLAMVSAELGGGPTTQGDDMPRTFLWQGKYWVSYGGATRGLVLTAAGQPVPVGKASVEMNVLSSPSSPWPSAPYPAGDANGLPTQSLESKGWDEHLVDTAFGKVATGVQVVLSDAQLDEVEAAAKAGAAEGAGSGTIRLTGTLSPQ